MLTQFIRRQLVANFINHHTFFRPILIYHHMNSCYSVNKSFSSIPIKNKHLNELNRQVNSWLQLLNRSGYHTSILQYNLKRAIHTSTFRYRMYSKFIYTLFFDLFVQFFYIEPSSSNPSPNNDQNSDPNKNKNDDDKKLIGYGLAWIVLGYTIITIISMLFPPANKPDVLRYVSWNEFYHQMLAKGEVELIVVKPDLDLVTIYLYEDAVIRGKRAPYRSYHMNIVNVPSFEARLREAEAQLGVKHDQSVQIIYERNQENVWFGLITILAIAAIISYFMRSSSMVKGPLNSNLFVCIVVQ